MNSADRTAAEIVTYVALERDDMASVRASDLLSQTSYLITRWDAQLSEQSKNNLLSAREQLTFIHEELTSKVLKDLALTEKARVAQACQRVNTIFSEEYGAAVRAGD
ncbi:MAG: hypothetical protein FJW37_14510 [Acidobacteria bacterium]|nr:hypothetical protein [Acidobacteriota bacterium]